MLHKTRGIVLNQLPYSDSSVIAHIYTEKFGRQSYWIQGAHSKRSKNKASALQPLFLLDMEVYHNEKGGLQKAKEIRNFPLFNSIPFEITKTTLAFFISEVLSRSLQEEEANYPLFSFLHNSILTLDLQQEKVSNFHLYFLLKLTKHLGFFPAGIYTDENCYFDYLSGEFIDHPPMHKCYITADLSVHFAHFLHSDFDDSMSYPLNYGIRNQVLKSIIEYYNHHFENICKIHSLNILKEVYHL